MDIKLESKGKTNAGIILYNENKAKISDIVRAKLHSSINDGGMILTLYDDHGDSISIVGAFTGGYWGEGPAGTFDVLKDAGFDVSESFIKGNEKFDIRK